MKKIRKKDLVMNKKSWIIVILVGVLCTLIGFGGSYILFDLNKGDYDKVKKELAELKEAKEDYEKIEIPILANGEEGVVYLKEEKTISANDLYNELKEQYALNTLLNMVDKKILEEKYVDYLSEAEASANETIKELQASYGDDLESAIQYYTGYQSVEAYKNYIYINYLQNLAIMDYAKAELKEKDIKKYYDEEIVGDIKVNHILITAKVTDDMTAEEKKEAENEAKEKINAIITELKNTNKEDVKAAFASLARENSNDESTKDNGGSLGFINKNTLSSSYDELVSAAYNLKDGEYSTSVITTELGYHVILREETKEKASLEDVEDSIKETLASKYLEENPTIQVKALQELRKEYGFTITDKDIKTEYNRYLEKLLK